jgi:hypothetical protein
VISPHLCGTQFRVFHIIAEYEDHGIWAQWSGEAWNMDMSIFTPWTQTEEFGQSTYTVVSLVLYVCYLLSPALVAPIIADGAVLASQ